MAATVKVAGEPGQADWLDGCVVIAGAVLTVSVAAELVTAAQVLVTTQS